MLQITSGSVLAKKNLGVRCTLRRWTANPMCSARVGSNPILVVSIVYIFSKSTDIGCYNNIPDLKKDILYNLLVMIGQWYNKDITMVDFVESKQAN